MNRSFAALLTAALACGHAAASQHVERVAAGRLISSSTPGSANSTFVVLSVETYSNVGMRMRNPTGFRDAAGSALIIAELPRAQVLELAQRVHDTEKRCGGFFTFDSRAEALSSLQAPKTWKSRNGDGGKYTLDNQATVDSWLPQVQALGILDTIDALSTLFPSRYYDSSHGSTASKWIANQWADLASGRPDIKVATVACGACAQQKSVILTIQGNELPDEIVVLGAHLDSISMSGTGEKMIAPGADDDASGIAVLTEVIRVALSNSWKPKRTVQFMAYAAEEVGLQGSWDISHAYSAEEKNVVGVLQLDMTNYKVGTGPDMRVVEDYTDADLNYFMKALFAEYLAPLGLTLGNYTCGYGCSDHAAWTLAGYRSTFIFEGGDDSKAPPYFPLIHTPKDRLENMNDSAEPSANFAKMGLAFLGEMAKTSGD